MDVLQPQVHLQRSLPSLGVQKKLDSLGRRCLWNGLQVFGDGDLASPVRWEYFPEVKSKTGLGKLDLENWNSFPSLVSQAQIPLWRRISHLVVEGKLPCLASWCLWHTWQVFRMKNRPLQCWAKFSGLKSTSKVEFLAWEFKARAPGE